MNTIQKLRIFFENQILTNSLRSCWRTKSFTGHIEQGFFKKKIRTKSRV